MEIDPRSEPASPPAGPASRPAPTLGALFRESAWLGVVGFGGGVSVLGMIGHLSVTRRRWLTEREFANTATVAQMLPGGAAANALAHVGLRLRGLSGAATAYVGFVLPGALLTLSLAWGYVRFGVAPRAEVVLSGLNAAVVGLVAALALRMVRTAVGRLWQMGVAAGALLLTTAGGASPAEVAALAIVAGLAVDLLWKRARLARRRRSPVRASPPVALPDEGQRLEPVQGTHEDSPPRGGSLLAAAVPVTLVAGAGGLLALGVLFFRAGLGAYGGGFAIVPHLHDTVVRAGWVSAQQFTDAVAVGKLTPGPVLLMATFIGYVAHGFPGALVATVAIFAAPFVLVVVLGAWLLRMRSRRSVRAALRGLTPAVVGLMASAAVTLGASLRGPAEVGIATATLLTLTRFTLSPVVVLLLAGALRFVLALGGM